MVFLETNNNVADNLLYVMHPTTCLLGRRLGNETLAAGAPTWFDSVKGPSLVQEKKIPMYGIRTYTYLVVLKVTAEVLVS